MSKSLKSPQTITASSVLKSPLNQEYPQFLTPDNLLYLQRTMGNQAVQRLLASRSKPFSIQRAIWPINAASDTPDEKETVTSSTNSLNTVKKSSKKSGSASVGEINSQLRGAVLENEQGLKQIPIGETLYIVAHGSLTKLTAGGLQVPALANLLNDNLPEHYVGTIKLIVCYSAVVNPEAGTSYAESLQKALVGSTGLRPEAKISVIGINGIAMVDSKTGRVRALSDSENLETVFRFYEKMANGLLNIKIDGLSERVQEYRKKVEEKKDQLTGIDAEMIETDLKRDAWALIEETREKYVTGNINLERIAQKRDKITAQYGRLGKDAKTRFGTKPTEAEIAEAELVDAGFKSSKKDKPASTKTQNTSMDDLLAEFGESEDSKKDKPASTKTQNTSMDDLLAEFDKSEDSKKDKPASTKTQNTSMDDLLAEFGESEDSEKGEPAITAIKKSDIDDLLIKFGINQ